MLPLSRTAAWVGLLASMFASACSRDFDQYVFGGGASGASGAGGANAVGGASGAGGTRNTGGAPGCALGELECAGTCMSATADASCGSCFNDCTAAGLSCVDGACGCADLSQCGAGGVCDPRSGTCLCASGPCGLGELCVSDACSCNGGPACGTGQLCCTSEGCVDPGTDARNCGGCGRRCRRAQTCVDGACQ